MAAHYGAHEVMEVHEILTCAIDGINTMQMFRPHVRDPQLAQMMDHQLQFALNEYNGMVQMLHSQGMGQAVPYRAPKQASPKYGLHQPPTQTPNMSPEELDDRDISSCLLGIHKSSSVQKMHGALECADPNLRRTLQQGAVNCSEQAYEVWQYMNQMGYYQVPTMKEMTTNTVMNSYGMAGQGGAGAMNAQMPMRNMGQQAAGGMGVMGGNTGSYGRDMAQTGNTSMMNHSGDTINH